LELFYPVIGVNVYRGGVNLNVGAKQRDA